MRVTMIVPVLDSHEVVRRHIRRFQRIGIPDEMEIFFMDDGSDPPLEFDHGLKNFKIIPTHDNRPWSEHVAKNKGARLANGEYLMMVDVDYIIPRTTMEEVIKFDGDRMGFRRYFGVLDWDGFLDARLETLRDFGLQERWMPTPEKPYFEGHRNNFAIRKDLFWEMGGYEEKRVGKAFAMGKRKHKNWNGPDSRFNSKWRTFVKAGKAVLSEHRPPIYMFPNGRFCGHRDSNPFGLFHSLKRE